MLGGDDSFIRAVALPVSAEDIAWVYKHSIQKNGKDHVLLRDDRFGVQKETYNKSDSYFIDNVPGEYHSVEELVSDLNGRLAVLKQSLALKRMQIVR